MADPIPQPPVTDIEGGKLYAALSYLGVLVLIPLLTQRNDSFVRFHAQQGLVILVGFILAVAAAQWIPVIGTLLFLLLLIVDVIGLLQALMGRWWKIPIVGDIANKFKV